MPSPSMPRPVPWTITLAGAALLAVSIVSALTLVMGHFGAMSVPGCGEGSPCAEAAASIWGSIPGIGWPTSFLGLAYFVGALVAWLASRRGLSRWLLACYRVGAAISLVFAVVILIDNQACPYCIAAHAGNVLFWILAERTRRAPSASLRPASVLVLTFAVVSAALAVIYWGAREQIAARSERERSESTARIIAAGQHRDAEPDGDREVPWEGGFRGRYLYGPDPAPIRIVMFTDYQCVDCNRIEKDVRAILQARDDVSLSIKHFPMSSDCNPHFDRRMHANACWAARAAEAAGILGGNEGFWKMHWWLFDHDGGFTNDELTTGLQQLGFDSQRFVQLMTSPRTLERVQADIEEAVWLGLHYTPMIFINGVELKGFTVPGALERTVQEVAAQDPPALTHAADQPPPAADKYIADWLAQGVRSLPPDRHPRILGPADAPVQVMVWGDLVEPFTARCDSIVRAILAQRSDVRYAFRLYPVNQACNPVAPLTKFDNACLAAKAAEAAYVLGGSDAYWGMHTALMRTGEAVDEQTVRSAALELGIDSQELIATMESPDVAAAIEEDARAGQILGLRSLPLVIVEGRRVPRWDLEGADILPRIVARAAADAPRR